jgi:hypothetical protein
MTSSKLSIAICIFILAGCFSQETASDTTVSVQQSVLYEPAYDSALVISGPFASESIVSMSICEFPRVFAKDLKYTRVRDPRPITDRLVKYNRADAQPKHGPDVRCLVILYGKQALDTIGMDAWRIMHHDTAYYNDSLISYIRRTVLKETF